MGQTIKGVYMSDKSGVSEVIVLGKPYYLNEGILYFYTGELGYAPVPETELARIILMQNDLLLEERDC
jgi:hypothetical protein